MKKFIALLLTGVLCMGLTACGQTKDAGSTAESQSTASVQESHAEESKSEESSTSTAESQAAEPELSGKVTVYMPSPAGLADKLAAGFTEKTGVEVEVF